jgi:D-3-phosphoglycerate dehydrogenase
MKIVIPQPVAPAGKTFLQERGYELLCLDTFSTGFLKKNLADCDAVLLRTAVMDRDLLAAGKKLRIVARHGVGFDNVDREAAAEMGIWVTNAPLSTTCSVAEYTMTCILMLAKQSLFFIQAMKAGNFAARSQCAGMEIENKTLSIIGLGRIGGELAKKAAHGFNMKVLAYDPACPPDRVPPEVELRQDLESALTEADFVSLHIPNTPDTKKMFGGKEFAVMKPTAYFINCARGEVVDETALCKALERGVIAGAALDVYDPEPPAKDNPLLCLPNVLASPHIASNTAEANDKMALHAAMEIHRVLSGEKPLWPVNRPIFNNQ